MRVYYMPDSARVDFACCSAIAVFAGIQNAARRTLVFPGISAAGPRGPDTSMQPLRGLPSASWLACWLAAVAEG